MDRPILYVNACVRKESRTKRLAEKLLSKLWSRSMSSVLLFDNRKREYLLLFAGQKACFM